MGTGREGPKNEHRGGKKQYRNKGWIKIMVVVCVEVKRSRMTLHGHEN